MAVRNISEIMESVRARFENDNDDNTLALVEDITDTLNDYENRTKETTDWKKKYEDNDSQWRTKYKDRFFTGGTEEENEPEIDDTDKPKSYKYEDLFK